MELNQNQAKTLWEVGGFLILRDLPEGSEFGIDGIVHIVKKFSGIKFLPPGIHLVSWSPPSSTAGPSVIPIRRAILRDFAPKERYILDYVQDHENVDVPADASTISDESLKTLDKELAPYPFQGVDAWKALISYLTPSVLSSVLGADGRVDGMMPVSGQDEDSLAKDMRDKLDEMKKKSEIQEAGYKTLKFARFDLKRSWREGAVGEEVTRFSRDKSWLLGHVIANQLHREPRQLLAHLQLSFILLLHLSSYSCLIKYKHILTLFCHSSSFLISPSTFLPPPINNPNASVGTEIKNFFREVINIVRTHLEALPDGAFETELPEMDVFFLDQLESLRKNLGFAIWGTKTDQDVQWKESERQTLKQTWDRLRDSAWKRWEWDVDELGHRVEDKDLEEGEYAPVIVKM
ncbi:uncharacterized protein L203_103626 [Cryptococcus depauperatus CBS 7841]|uniref:Uncharacterized protein n=1 Tax=Cryptococcus depauperatus CBS 7841 TaxID=1295531 RepID=A0A1E3IHV0_9TREE|nr:A1 cistron-splicing factor AAR2 [Cryptococcus depauperatus CBS 7841]